MMNADLKKRVEFAIDEQEGNFGILDALEELYKYANSLEQICTQLREEKMRTVEVVHDAVVRAEAAETKLTTLASRIARAQARLDADPMRQPDYLALSADLRGEIGRVGAVPQYGTDDCSHMRDVKTVDKWYCMKYAEDVQPTEVTYEETHEGCGGLCSVWSVKKPGQVK